VRDVERVCQYFARYHIQQDAHALADFLWSRYERENALDASAILVGLPDSPGEGTNAP